MAVPEKYSHIDFTPPSGVRREAEYGLKLRREYGRGGTAVGIARARDLSNGEELSPSTVRRMKAFFDRHQSDESAPGFNRGDKEWPSNGLIANKLWGGPSGYSWSRKVVEQMNAADEKSEGRSLRPKGSTGGVEPRVLVVYGPPGSGKRDYVAKHRGDNDVTFDFDSIMQSLSGKPAYEKNENLISYCLDIRNLILERSMRQPKVDRTWIITTRADESMRGSLRDVPVRYVEMETPKDECLRRVCEDPLRQGSLDEARAVIESYFAEVNQRSMPVSNNVERRYIGAFSSVERADPSLLSVERRADPQGGKPRTYITGYAAKFGTDSLMLGDFIERIAPTAFEIVEKREDFDGKPLETRCLFNHSPDHLLGRFPNTLRMWVDEKGLRYECLLPESRQDLAELIERGDLRGSSFSFVVAEGGEKWSTEEGRSIRLVTKIKALLDVSPVTYPAYGDASVAVAKRSYEHFVAEKKQKKETRSFVREKAASIREEAGKFLAERRDCGRDDAGRFDKGNSCGGATEAGAGDSSWREGAKVGAIIGAGVGSATGVGAIAGAAAGAVGGAIVGTTGLRGPNKSLEKAYKSTGTSLKQFDKAAKQLGMKATVSTPDGGKSIVMESGDDVAVVESQSPFSSDVKGTSFHYQPASGDKLDVPSLEKAAKAVGAKSVSVEAWTDGAAKTLESKGFRRVSASPGGFSTSKGVFLKTLDKKSRRSVQEFIDFLAERRDCGRDGTGRFGSGNKCQDQGDGKYMEWEKGKDKEAQDFIDKARTDQTISAGKDGGKADDGGGVQTWSKGDHYPWTAKQVGSDEGYVQGQHPDGSKTEKYPFSGGKTDEAYAKLAEELKKKSTRSVREVVADTMTFLKDRRR